MPTALTPSQFLAVLLLVTTLLLFAGNAIIRSWVNSVNGAVAALNKYDDRLKRLEGHNFYDLRGQVHTLMFDATLMKKDIGDYKITNDSRVTRAEATLVETEKTLDGLRTSVASIEVMVRDMWERRKNV